MKRPYSVLLSVFLLLGLFSCSSTEERYTEPARYRYIEEFTLMEPDPILFEPVVLDPRFNTQEYALDYYEEDDPYLYANSFEYEWNQYYRYNWARSYSVVHVYHDPWYPYYYDYYLWERYPHSNIALGFYYYGNYPYDDPYSPYNPFWDDSWYSYRYGPRYRSIYYSSWYSPWGGWAPYYPYSYWGWYRPIYVYDPSWRYPYSPPRGGGVERLARPASRERNPEIFLNPASPSRTVNAAQTEPKRERVGREWSSGRSATSLPRSGLSNAPRSALSPDSNILPPDLDRSMDVYPRIDSSQYQSLTPRDLERPRSSVSTPSLSPIRPVDTDLYYNRRMESPARDFSNFRFEVDTPDYGRVSIPSLSPEHSPSFSPRFEPSFREPAYESPRMDSMSRGFMDSPTIESPRIESPRESFSAPSSVPSISPSR